MQSVQEAPHIGSARSGTIVKDQDRKQAPRSGRDRTWRHRAEREFAAVAERIGCVLKQPENEKKGSGMKHKALATWRESDQARTVSAAARELVTALVDIAGPKDRRYADGRLVAVLYVGQRTLAEKLGMSVPGVKARLRSLSRAGIIARHRRPQGWNSITVLELVTTRTPQESQDLRRRIHPCPTVGYTLVPPSDTPLSESSSSVTSSSEKSSSGSDYDARVLSAACDAGAEEQQPRKGPDTLRVREALIEFGVNPQTLPSIEAKHTPEVIAAVGTLLLLLRRLRPGTPFLKDQGKTGRWIGAVLLKGNPIPAWIERLLEESIENERNERAAAATERTLDRLRDAGMFGEPVYRA